ncbi:MAG: hypothetical protein JXR70_02185, partial [Spirochaetales bacterium]|nr:hypothetical protein [Spirochaetales bacterium]
PRISKRSGVMESLACCNEMKAGNAQRNNQINKYQSNYSQPNAYRTNRVVCQEKEKRGVENPPGVLVKVP